MAKQVYAIFGTDDGTMAEEALKLFNKLKPEGSDDFANDVIEGVADNAESAFQIAARTIEALQTLPFFGGNKIVWLKNANFLASDRTSEAERTKQGVEALADIIKSGLSEDVTFLVSGVACDKRRSFYKALKEAGTIKHFDKPDVSRDGWQDQVAQFVEKKASELGLRFQPDALELFIMLAGEDTRQIRQELEKLDLYVGEEKMVTLESVRTMTPLSRAGVVWEISRAIEKGDGARAIELIDQQLHRGENAIGIIRAAIIPTIRNLFLARTLIDYLPNLSTHSSQAFKAALERIPAQDRNWLPTTKTGAVNTWGLFNAARSCKRYSMAGLRKVLEATLRADKALVTTGLEQRMVLHRLIAEILAQQIKPKRQRAHS